MLTEKEKENFFKNIDRITIITDRYEGSAMGGRRWLAFFNDYWDMPDGFDGGDFEYRDFWEDYKGWVGFGNTPNEAAIDLAERLKERGGEFWFKD